MIGCLRHAKPARGRKPKGGELRGKLVGMTNIKDRPEEIEGRLVPGHLEGDLILGARGASALNAISESLRKISDSLNPRPRKTLNLATPGEHFRTLLAGLAC